MPTLSICIPTYNRSAFLAELLDSIIAQGMPEIEVIVSDDASSDDTALVAESYAGRIVKYRFIRQQRNLGLDRNFLAVVAAATGDYIWAMGDDDRLEPGGAARVLAALERWPGVSGLTLGVIDYDPTMRHVVGVRAMPATQLIEGIGPVFRRMAELLGFLSALVLDRAKCQEIAGDPSVDNFHNYYVQVYITGRVIERYRTWGVVQEPCVGFRTGNDQFKTGLGWLPRLKIDVRAYDQIADALFAQDAATHAAMRRRIFATHVLARIANAKTARAPTPGIWAAARYLFGSYGAMPAYWTRAVPALLAPKWAMRAVRAVYRRWATASGTARARQLSAL